MHSLAALRKISVKKRGNHREMIVKKKKPAVVALSDCRSYQSVLVLCVLGVYNVRLLLNISWGFLHKTLV
jgi:hypothetical protein